MQHKLAAHVSESTSAWQAAERGRAEAAAANAQIAAATAAAAQERTTAATELAALREKCAMRSTQADEAKAQLASIEESAVFERQQITSVQVRHRVDCARLSQLV